MLAKLQITQHAQGRMRQRSVRDSDLPLFLNSASPIAEDAYLLTEQDVAREIARRKHEIQRLDRLRGVKLVMEGGALVTCYHTSRRGQTTALRRGRAFR